MKKACSAPLAGFFCFFVERGAHEELMEKGGSYYHLLTIQQLQ
ncbi:hypothetical protein GS8_2983 [Geobacillus stearothermophilus]|uniref:Uncharacterized protein n=1 Tax=Geobacillus stearothermophilus TaxID=1422 RepID=A0A150NEY6_GEOSE|nr:hypothetical protein GS8_2983 [Geobacillus stearothermophilus]KYD35248.1 hypothetical protein B4114_0411 [Geobacillus stearothermophilus]